MHPVVGDSEDPDFNNMCTQGRKNPQDDPEAVTNFELGHDDRKSIQKLVVNNNDERNDDDIEGKDGEQLSEPPMQVCD